MKQIVFTEKNTAKLLDAEEREPKENEVVVKTMVSTISCGTERANIRLCDGGRLNLDNMVDETHSPNECESVYTRLIFDKDFPTVVRFNWRKLQ